MWQAWSEVGTGKKGRDSNEVIRGWVLAGTIARTIHVPCLLPSIPSRCPEIFPVWVLSQKEESIRDGGRPFSGSEKERIKHGSGSLLPHVGKQGHGDE